MFLEEVLLDDLDEELEEEMKLAEHCSICNGEIDLDAGDIQGYFGIAPVSFCVWCYSSILDMVKQAVPCWCEEEE